MTKTRPLGLKSRTTRPTTMKEIMTQKARTSQTLMVHRWSMF
jgi:hypothetical protein